MVPQETIEVRLTYPCVLSQKKTGLMWKGRAHALASLPSLLLLFTIYHSLSSWKMVNRASGYLSSPLPHSVCLGHRKLIVSLSLNLPACLRAGWAMPHLQGCADVQAWGIPSAGKRCDHPQEVDGSCVSAGLD